MGKKIDELFIRLAKLFRTIEEEGLIPVKLIDGSDIVDEFYNKSVKMVLDGRVTEHIDLVLSFELAKAVRNTKIDDESIQCMILIKKLIEPIRSGLRYDDIIEFSKIWASTGIYHEINDEILQKYIEREFEEQNPQEICSMKLDNFVEIEKIDKEILKNIPVKFLKCKSLKRMIRSRFANIIENDI